MTCDGCIRGLPTRPCALTGHPVHYGTDPECYYTCADATDLGEQELRALRKWAAGEMEATRPAPTAEEVERMAEHLCPYAWTSLSRRDRREWLSAAREALRLGARLP